MTEQGPGLLGSPGIIPEDKKFLHNQRIGLFININYQKADKKFLKRFLVKSGYMKFNRFSDEYTSYDPNRLSHLPKGLVDTLLMKVDISK